MGATKMVQVRLSEYMHILQITVTCHARCFQFYVEQETRLTRYITMYIKHALIAVLFLFLFLISHVQLIIAFSCEQAFQQIITIWQCSDNFNQTFIFRHALKNALIVSGN